MRGLFVTATDTGVGKTVVSAVLLAAMAAAGEPMRAYKPVVTGLEDPEEIAARGQWPADHELLASVTGMSPEEVSPLRFGPAVSPHLAAELAGEPIEFGRLVAAAHANDGDTLIVEGVGGLLAPLTDAHTICDFAAVLALPVVIAARPGLGTINHSLLTLSAARAGGLDVRAIVLTPWPGRPSRMQVSNRETIARVGAVEVDTLATIAGPVADDLRRAGETLPWRRWLERC